MQSITRSVEIDAPRAKVWEVLADFGNVYRTNKAIKASKLTSSQTSGVGMERACDLTMMNAKLYERVAAWHEGERLDIDIYEWSNMPGIGSMGAVFTLTDEGSRTLLAATMRYEMKWGVVGRAMDSILMRNQNVKGWEEFVVGIKHHVETGEIVDKTTKLDRGLVRA